MKKLLTFLFVFILLGFTGISHANLLTNGDFEDTTATVPYGGGAFTLGTSAFGEWYAQRNWFDIAGGPSGSAFYLDHALGSGDDQKAFQPVDTSGFNTTGVEFTLDFDYYLAFGETDPPEPTDPDNPGSLMVGLVGLSASGDRYVAYGGSTIDGDYGNNTIIDSKILAETSGWGNDSLTVTLSQDFEAIVVAFAGNGWRVGEGGLQGIDNVSLTTASVPEPSTIALMGLGLIGMAGLGRKKLLRK